MARTCETLFTSLAYHWFLSTNPEAPREDAWEFAHEQWQEYQTGLRIRVDERAGASVQRRANRLRHCGRVEVGV